MTNERGLSDRSHEEGGEASHLAILKLDAKKKKTHEQTAQTEKRPSEDIAGAKRMHPQCEVRTSTTKNDN